MMHDTSAILTFRDATRRDLHAATGAAFRGVQAAHALLIAERDGMPVGFVHLQVRTDALSGQQHGHVS